MERSISDEKASLADTSARPTAVKPNIESSSMASVTYEPRSLKAVAADAQV